MGPPKDKVTAQQALAAKDREIAMLKKTAEEREEVAAQ